MKPKRHLLQVSIVLSSIFFFNAAYTQTMLPRHALTLTSGYSRHGTGDMPGIIFGTEYTHYHTRKLSLNYAIRAGINHSEHTLLISDPYTGKVTDGSLRFTTAGVQLGINGQYSMIRTSKHELLFSLGAFGRYQSSTYPDIYSVYYPQVTGVPELLVGFHNITPQNTYALGGLFQIHYNFTFNNKMFLGVAPGFQTDTNGDALPQVAFTIGRRLY